MPSLTEVVTSAIKRMSPKRSSEHSKKIAESTVKFKAESLARNAKGYQDLLSYIDTGFNASGLSLMTLMQTFKNTSDEDGFTILMNVVRNGAISPKNLMVAKSLVELGADLGARDKYGNSVVYYLSILEKELNDELQRLFQGSSEIAPTVDSLLEKNVATPFQLGMYGSTDRVHILQDIKRYSKVVIQILNGLQNKAYKNHPFSPRENGRSVLYTAMSLKTTFLVKNLIKCGANVDITRCLTGEVDPGNHPIYKAAFEKDIELLKLMAIHQPEAFNAEFRINDKVMSVLEILAKQRDMGFIAISDYTSIKQLQKEYFAKAKHFETSEIEVDDTLLKSPTTESEMKLKMEALSIGAKRSSKSKLEETSSTDSLNSIPEFEMLSSSFYKRPLGESGEIQRIVSFSHITKSPSTSKELTSQEKEFDDNKPVKIHYKH